MMSGLGFGLRFCKVPDTADAIACCVILLLVLDVVVKRLAFVGIHIFAVCRFDDTEAPFKIFGGGLG